MAALFLPAARKAAAKKVGAKTGADPHPSTAQATEPRALGSEPAAGSVSDTAPERSHVLTAAEQALNSLELAGVELRQIGALAGSKVRAPPTPSA